MEIAYNWLIFVTLLIVLYISNYYLEKILKKRYKEVTKLEDDILKLRLKEMKSVEEQLKYIKLKEERSSIFGSVLQKFFFMLFMLISYSIILPYFNTVFFKLLSVVGFSIIVPYLFVVYTKKKYALYNYLSLFFIFIFFSGYMEIQSIDPLKFMGFNITILILLPFLLLVNGIGRFIIGKIKNIKQRSK